MYDVTLKETFQKVEKWVEELKLFNKESEFVIAGNNSDLNKFDVDREEINEFAFNNKIPNFYTSTKSGEGISVKCLILFLKGSRSF